MESHIIYLALIEQLCFMVLIMSFLYLHTKPVQILNFIDNHIKQLHLQK